MSRKKILLAGALLFVGMMSQGLWTGTPAGARESAPAGADSARADSSAAVENPHGAGKEVTPETFGRDLFMILKNQDFEGVKKYLWHEEDWAYIAELGHGVPKEKQVSTNRKVASKYRESITRYHEGYFKIGAPYEGTGEPIRSVEYIGFIPGRTRRVAPEYVQYNDSSLRIRVNGSIEKQLEIDHIQVIDGVWHISEIR